MSQHDASPDRGLLDPLDMTALSPGPANARHGSPEESFACEVSKKGMEVSPVSLGYEKGTTQPLPQETPITGSKEQQEQDLPFEDAPLMMSPEEERRLLWKIDLHLIPFVVAL